MSGISKISRLESSRPVSAAAAVCSGTFLGDRISPLSDTSNVAADMSGLCEEILKAVQSAVNLPVVVKMTPQLSDATGMAKRLKACGAKAVTVMHRFQGLMVDPETDAPVLGGGAAIGGS